MPKKLINRFNILLFLGLIPLSSASLAVNTQVCTNASGTFSGTTVTRTGTCSTFQAYDGLASTFVVPQSGSCIFTFSPAISNANLSSAITGFEGNDIVGFKINGAPYTLSVGDIDNTTTPPNSAGNLTLSGNTIIHGNNGIAAAGTIHFNSAPASVTSVEIDELANNNAFAANICFTPGPALISQATLNVVGTPAAIYVGHSSALSTTGGSGSGAVTYSLVSGPCTLSGSTLTGTSAGSCVVNATKAADATYSAATSSDATITVTVAPAPTTPSQIPTLGEWAQMMLMLMLAYMAVWYQKKAVK